MRIEHHPIGVWVREDGCVYLPQSGKNPAHWTFGWKEKTGYLRVRFNGKNYRVHRLVAETFIPNPENLHEVDHKDRCPVHNNFENLRWTTPSQNCRNRSDNDRVDARGGTHKYEDVRQYWKEYWKERGSLRNKTHKCVLLSDGKKRWVPKEQATELLKIPVKERVYEN